MFRACSMGEKNGRGFQGSMLIPSTLFRVCCATCRWPLSWWSNVPMVAWTSGRTTAKTTWITYSSTIELPSMCTRAARCLNMMPLQTYYVRGGMTLDGIGWKRASTWSFLHKQKLNLSVNSNRFHSLAPLRKQRHQKGVHTPVAVCRACRCFTINLLRMVWVDTDALFDGGGWL